MGIREITILPGQSKTGVREGFREITLGSGETVSIVGPTGSGKTAFITDIELLAQGDTSTRRRILINGEVPGDEIRYNPALKPIAMITQNTKCFADLSINDFLTIHARARSITRQQVIIDTVDLANVFTGEKIHGDMRVTVLSGGQTRALLIADALLIGAAPVILLDEIENAGILKQEVLRVIKDTSKIVIFVTHDPVIALLTKQRVVMENGAVKSVLYQSEQETKAAKRLLELDRWVGAIRENVRAGKVITRELTSITFA